MITFNPNSCKTNHITCKTAQNTQFQSCTGSVECQKDSFNRVHANKKTVFFGTCLYRETVGSSFSNALYGTVNNATHFFRVHINDLYADGIIKKFPKGVKIFNYACSDGSEPYSLVMLLINKLGFEEARKKYFPIIAKDISPAIIKQAQKGIIGLNEQDEKEIINLLRLKNLNKFFKPVKLDEQPIGDDFKQFWVPDVLRENVVFSKSDICQDAKNPEIFKGDKPGPSLLLFRNAMYHLTNEQQKTLYADLFNNPGFEEGSVCDFYNVENPINNALTELKMFRPCNLSFNKLGNDLVFKKIGKER